MDTPKMDTPKMKQEFENVMAFQRSIGRTVIRWPHRGCPPPAEWLQWRHAATCARRVSLFMNSGIMLPDELAPMAALCLEYRAQARRLWRAWLKVKPAFDRSRRDVN